MNNESLASKGTTLSQLVSGAKATGRQRRHCWEHVSAFAPQYVASYMSGAAAPVSCKGPPQCASCIW